MSEQLSWLTGRIITSDMPRYAEVCTGWNSRIRHRPEVVVTPGDAADVQAAVRFAAELSLPVRVQSTGHGALAAAEGGLLLDTSALTGIRLDPVARTAEVGAGIRWQELLEAAHPYGLAGLSGSSGNLGVTGYALGGGSGWLARKHGLCSDSILAAEIVTANGRLRWVDTDREPELWQAVRGGGPNVGVITKLRLGLVTVPQVFAGAVYWPIEDAAEVFALYRDWVAGTPLELTSALTFLQYPESPALPEPLRGRTLVALRGVYAGPESAAAEVLHPLRSRPGAVLDTFREMAYREIDTVTNDPVKPLPRTGYSTAVTELPAGLVELAKPGESFVSVEARHVAGEGARLGAAGAEFLVFTMAVTPDETSVAEAGEFGRKVAQVCAPYRTGHNLMSFLLAPPEAGGLPEQVAAAFPAEYREQLAAVKAHYDPAGLFGGDRKLIQP
ncbi:MULTISPECIES: FAD-binding oxidoreductase [unclassified Crossiella]|uniref:FAD-binding oxidoreductase n=1 Tax=unclassified Crossiella TaxID=2620835 RepID=UPI001FFECF8A|nr:MULTISPECIES: FAD-binding oxidoreductase [unclassified Crossiella]MCK2240833.1 FAD-binding oxidoreductase [Crossiella sp. S99.2]MCK2254023.1 FAD-binding oxidoreductase [Crossiella sp. S99.1]